MRIFSTAEFYIAVLLCLSQVVVVALGIDHRFWFGVAVCAGILLVTARLIWMLATRFGPGEKISAILVFAAAFNLFVFPHLQRRYEQERAAAGSKSPAQPNASAVSSPVTAPAEPRTQAPPAAIALLTAENAPGQALVQVKNTGERTIFSATARMTKVVEYAGNAPLLHSYPLRWTVHNQSDLSLESGAMGQLLIASTHETPRRRPSDTPLYEVIFESYQGGQPSQARSCHWNGGELDGIVSITLEVTLSSVGHGTVVDHFVVSSMKWGGIKIEKTNSEPAPLARRGRRFLGTGAGHDPASTVENMSSFSRLL